MGYTVKDGNNNAMTVYDDGCVDLRPDGESTFMTDINSIIKILKRHGYYYGGKNFTEDVSLIDHYM